jgi:RNA polymerase sigma-70 factor (ECF subfamily)
MDEKSAIEQVLAGDRDAFEPLLRAHHVKVTGLCRSILGTVEAAEDAAQEAFLKAFRHLKDFRQDAQFSTWLSRIAYRHCLDILKQNRRRFTESLDAPNPNEETLGERIADPVSFTRQLELRDMAEVILNRLSPEHRMVLTLREVQGLSYEEIANLMDSTLDSVKGRLKRARQALLEIARHLEAGQRVQESERTP